MVTLKFIYVDLSTKGNFKKNKKKFINVQIQFKNIPCVNTTFNCSEIYYGICLKKISYLCKIKYRYFGLSGSYIELSLTHQS